MTGEATVMVKVSAANARQRFHGCTPDYIRTVCHGACCRSSTSPSGTLITIHPSEQAAIEAAGATVRENLLVPVHRSCPFQRDGLCGLHGSPAKPFGCIASPFTLNRAGTLVVRNRYRRLRCYRDDRDGPPPPAYRAFRASLDLIFGSTVAQQLIDHLDAGGGDIRLPASADAYQKLIDNDRIKHAVTTTPPAAPPGTPNAAASAVVHDLAVTREPVSSLHTYYRNPRQGDLAAIRQSLAVNGQYRPLVANRGTHTGRPREVLAGNHTLMAARDAGWSEVAVCWVDVDDDHAARIVAADNRTADLGGYDERLLAELLGDLPDLAGTGYTEDDLDRIVHDLSNGDTEAAAADDDEPQNRPSLADRFLIPPFSVLDARLGWWQDRKRSWLSAGLTGIESHAGRDAHLIYRSNSASPNYYEHKDAAERRVGRELSIAEFEAEHFQPRNAVVAAGTSVFDPVLAEIVYRWFCPPGGHVIDPWAGGSVRGLVAAVLGLPYTGVELRAEQITANEDQVSRVLGEAPAVRPRWLEGDCLDVLPTVAEADLVFGCPPYFDLERYSDDPRDLSTMDTEQYITAYRQMIALAAERLRPDRYAVLVVGSARDRRGGLLRDLRGLTVDAAHAAGLGLLNEAVLITMIGSLPHRAARMFTGTRVLGRSHQDVLVFVKGDRKCATAAAGEVDVTDALAVLGSAEEDADYLAPQPAG